MRVTVRLFAGLRERAGWSQREIEASRVSDVGAPSISATNPPDCFMP